MKIVSEIKGHYAFVAMFENGQLAAIKFHEPLIIVGRDDFFLSSDVLGFTEFTDNAVYLENGNFVILDPLYASPNSLDTFVVSYFTDFP